MCKGLADDLCAEKASRASDDELHSRLLVGEVWCVWCNKAGQINIGVDSVIERVRMEWLTILPIEYTQYSNIAYGE